MRVCIVTVASYLSLGGMQDHTCDLAAGLVSLGHEVDVITGRRPDGISLEERDGARWHFLDVRAKLKGTPFRHPRWFAESAACFARLHAEKPFDVVHSESTSALGLVRRRVDRRVPLVAKFHGNYLGLVRAAGERAKRERTAHAAFREAKKVAWVTTSHVTPPSNVYGFRRCEALIPSRQQVEATVRSHFLDPSRVHVVPNGIRTDVFRPRPREEARRALGLGKEPTIVTVGRLHPEKGVTVALKALARLNGASAPRLMLVGDGPQRSALESEAHSLGVSDRVTFTGRLTHDEVASHLAAADVAVLPTVRDEAAPLVVPQAMAVGVPVVASSIGGITEVVNEPGTNGILVPPGDVEALADAVRNLLADPEAAERIGDGGRRRVLEDYTVERMTERTLAVYEIAAARLGSWPAR